MSLTFFVSAQASEEGTRTGSGKEEACRDSLTPSRLGEGRVLPCSDRVLWRDDGQTAGARLLMRAKLAHRDSQLTAKVTVVARAYSEISERNVVPRQMKMMRCHAIRFQKDRGEN